MLYQTTKSTPPRLYRSPDDWSAWTEITHPTGSGKIVQMSSDPSNNVIAQEGTVFYYSTNSGSTWARFDLYQYWSQTNLRYAFTDTTTTALYEGLTNEVGVVPTAGATRWSFGTLGTQFSLKGLAGSRVINGKTFLFGGDLTNQGGGTLYQETAGTAPFLVYYTTDINTRTAVTVAFASPWNTITPKAITDILWTGNRYIISVWVDGSTGSFPPEYYSGNIIATCTDLNGPWQPYAIDDVLGLRLPTGGFDIAYDATNDHVIWSPFRFPVGSWTTPATGADFYSPARTPASRMGYEYVLLTTDSGGASTLTLAKPSGTQTISSSQYVTYTDVKTICPYTTGEAYFRKLRNGDIAVAYQDKIYTGAIGGTWRTINCPVTFGSGNLKTYCFDWIGGTKWVIVNGLTIHVTQNDGSTWETFTRSPVAWTPTSAVYMGGYWYCLMITGGYTYSLYRSTNLLDWLGPREYWAAPVKTGINVSPHTNVCLRARGSTLFIEAAPGIYDDIYDPFTVILESRDNGVTWTTFPARPSGFTQMGYDPTGDRWVTINPTTNQYAYRTGTGGWSAGQDIPYGDTGLRMTARGVGFTGTTWLITG